MNPVLRWTSLLLLGWLVVGCSSGPVRRVSEPAASIQQLTVNADGSWSVDLRLQNFSSIPMRFEGAELAITVGDQAAGSLKSSPQISIGPESADVVTLPFKPSVEARMVLADSLASRRSVGYTLKGELQAVPDEKKSKSFDIDARNTSRPCPAWMACCAEAPARSSACRPTVSKPRNPHSHMSNYKAPLADIRFAMYDVLDADELFAKLGYGDATRDVLDAVLDEAARFTETVLTPLNSVGDEVGCSLDKASGEVTTPPGFREAYRQFIEGGWTGLTAAPEHGGQGLPHAMGVPLNEMINAANLAWGNFPLLSHGAVEALKQHGEDWQREAFLKPIVEGRWTGTMCLTEPHCGTDLGLLKTRAEPNADGSYAITGTKIFITAGEHDLTENIVHLVLAKLPDAPAGAKGISLFVTPKFKVSRDGSMGERNALRCGSIEHKMGIKGSVTCVMNFDGAEGYLVGQPHKGLQAMFTMMNTARLGVGLQGVGLSERAYQNALAYSLDRLQTRSLSGPKFPGKPADPIIVHHDVRRMLLTIKSLVEGSRLLALHAGTLIDVAHHAADAAEREAADVLVSFLTPISKGCQTEWGIENTYNALQCFGGHGYIHEHGMEQLARDARITTLYEGTTGIQSLDLMGRKTAASKAAGLKLFLAQIEDFAKRHEADESLAEFIAPLRSKASEWATLTQGILQRAAQDPEEIGAASTDYLFYSGYVALAYWWARSVVAARNSAHSESFKQSKLETARFYFARILPRTLAHAAAIESGAGSLMAMDAERFGV